MSATLAHFAIHVDDLARARAFYEAVFGWRFEEWGPPGFLRIHTGGIEGAMHRRSEPRTGTGLNGIEATFAVDDAAEIAARVAAHGGTVTFGPGEIPTVGTLVRFLDPEGNDVGAMAYVSPSPAAS